VWVDLGIKDRAKEEVADSPFGGGTYRYQSSPQEQRCIWSDS